MPAGIGELAEAESASAQKQSAPRRLVLDVGCGINKCPGAIGIDRNLNTRADVIVDLDQYPFPFADSSFREVRAIHVIEHVSNVIRTIEEFYRLLEPGGRAIIVTPHYTDFSSFCDPTHRWHLNSFSLKYFGEDHGGYAYYSPANFREIFLHVRLLALWRYLGFEFLVNRSRRFRRFWEFYLCYLVRGKVIEWRLAAVKENAAAGRSDLGSYSGN
ncbi:MAG: methyltransferase domain-containing protein [Acidobacteriaceae bacterium]|nr:methyltransferase domain-containing protein [Acidobacteriaceae bacterium]